MIEIRKLHAEWKRAVERVESLMEQHGEPAASFPCELDDALLAYSDWAGAIRDLLLREFGENVLWDGRHSLYVTIVDDPEEQNERIEIRISDHGMRYAGPDFLVIIDDPNWEENLKTAIQAGRRLVGKT